MTSFSQLTTELETSVEQLNELLQGDENTTVEINGVQKPSVEKKTKDTVNAQVQFVLDAAADIDAVKYASTAAGLSATTSGQFFTVVSQNDDSFLDLYENQDGAAIFKKSYPSKDLFNVKSAGLLFTQGGIDNQGNDVENSIRIRTDYFRAHTLTFTVGIAQLVRYHLYDNDKNLVSISAYNSSVEISGVDGYVRLSVKNIDESNILPEDVDVISEKIDYPSKMVGSLSDNLKKEIKEVGESTLTDFTKEQFYQGGVGLISGVDSSTSKRVRTDFLVAHNLNLELSPSQLINVYYYNSEKVFDSAVEGGNTVSISNYSGYVRLSVKNADDSDISPNELQIIKGKIDFLSLYAIKLERKIDTLQGIPNYWKGKKVVALGDSITYGFIPRNYTGYPGQLQSWLPLVANKLSMSYVNYGISGSTLANLGDGSRNPFTTRYQLMDDDADLIIVMGGTNDFRNSIPLGQLGDDADSTFYGALHVLCKGLINKYYIQQGLELGMKKQILFMTPIKIQHRSTGELDTAIEPFVTAIKEVCSYFSIPVFDSYNLSGITPHIFQTVVGTDPDYSDNYNPYITDGTHPTQEGHELWAKGISGFLSQLCK